MRQIDKNFLPNLPNPFTKGKFVLESFERGERERERERDMSQLP